VTRLPAGARGVERLAAFALLAALTALVFAPALPGDRVFYFRDVSQNHVPYRQLTLEMMRAGEAPLWNPHRGAGQPLLANPNALVLHPTTLLFFALPFPWAFKISIIGQILLAAMGTWLLLRDLGTGWAASLVGACAFAFSGCMLSLGSLVNLLDAAAFMPLTLWLCWRALTRGFAPWGSLAALSLAVQMMAGEPAVLLITGLAFVGLHGSHVPPRGSERGGSTRLMVTAGIVLLAAALAMVGLLPGLEMLSRSERGAGFSAEEAMKWSIAPSAMAETFLRGVFGDPARTARTAWWGGPLNDTGLPFLLSLYIGPAVMVLAGFGVAAGWRARGAWRAEAIAHGAMALAGGVLAAGRFLPVYPALVSWFPPLLSVRYPAKYMLLVVWAAAVLAARGYDDLARRAEGPWRPSWRGQRTALAAGGGVAALTLLLWVSGALGWTRRVATAAGPGVEPAELSSISRHMSGAILECGLVAAVVLLLALWRPRRLAPVALAVLPIASLVAAGVRVNPVAPEDFYRQPAALLQTLQTAGGSRLWPAPRPRGFAFRTPEGKEGDSLVWGFLWDRMTLRNATAFPSGVRFAYDRGNERLDVLPGAILGRRLADDAAEGTLTGPDVRLLAAAGVDRVLAYGDAGAGGLSEVGRMEGRSNMPVRLLAVPSTVPRAHAVTRAEVQPEIDRALMRLQDPAFDPLTSVILEEPSPLPHGARGESHAASSAPAASIVRDAPNRVALRVSLPSPGFAVLSDTWYPGWKARVDGRETPVIRANGMFRAAAVPAGDHDVTFSFEPTSVRSGAFVSAVSFLLAMLLAVPRRR
jgi:hypothetical protein